jgi:SAM-dependent methyltransferase
MGNPNQPVAVPPRRMYGDTRPELRKLMKPPRVETILKASEAFSCYYDEWMKSHHRIAGEMLRKYRYAGHIGRVVTEDGCGTAVLTSMLILARQREIFEKLGKDGKLDEPFTFICLDFSEKMLQLAKANIAECLNAFIPDADMQPIPLDKKFGFGTNEEDKQDLQQLTYNGSPVINVRFACKDASRLKEVPDGDKTETLVLSYVLHWLRGMEGKLKTLQELHEVLPAGSKLISIEATSIRTTRGYRNWPI